jgi:putative ABC transport system permease protein
MGRQWVLDIARDVRFSARLLTKERSFILVAVLALALGIGVNNTQFTVVNAICLRGLPIADADRVIDLSNRDEAHRPLPLSGQQFDDLLASRPPTIEALSAYATRPATLRDEQVAAESVSVAYVSANAFAVLRQRPMLGRDFRAEDARAGSTDVAILAADVWRRRYGAVPGIVGGLFRVDRAPVSVIGVIPMDSGSPTASSSHRGERCGESANGERLSTAACGQYKGPQNVAFVVGSEPGQKTKSFVCNA